MEEIKTQFSLEFSNDINLEPISSLEIGKLYLARDNHDDSLINLVVIRPGYVKGPDLSGQYMQRLVRVSQLDYSHIAPKYVYSIKSIHSPHEVVEYFQGVWLKDQLTELAEKNQYLPTIQALTLIRQLAEAIAAANGSGILFQNLSPENIFVNDSGEVRAINLGVPWFTPLTQETGNGRSKGLLDYESPEQILGKGISIQSNIYTLGIILYELLAGHRPAQLKSQWDIFEEDQIESYRAVPLEEVREGLRPETYFLVRECLRWEDWNRFENYDDLIAAIDEAISAEEAPEAEAVILPEGRRPEPRQIVVPIILLLLLMGFVIIRNNIGGFSGQSTITPQPTEVQNLSITPEVASIAQSESTNSPQPTRAVVQFTPAMTTNASTESRDEFILNSPSSDSEFGLDENISFDWSWPLPLEPSQQFSVYLYSHDERIFIGTVNEPSEGNSYHLLYRGENPIAPGSFFWQVVLEEEPAGEVVAESDLSLITFTPSTQLSLSDASRLTATSAAEIEGTPENECRPLQPEGWIAYIVKPDDALSALAVRSNITVEQVQQVNCLDGILLSIGQTLWLPPVSVRSTTAFTPTPIPPTAGPPTEPPQEPPSDSDSDSDSDPTPEPPATPTPPLPPTEEPPTPEPPTPEPPSNPTPTPP